MHVHGSRQSGARLSLALLSLACLSFLAWWHLCHRTARTEQTTGWMLYERRCKTRPHIAA